MMMTRSGSVVPRWIATTLITSVGLGMRGRAVTVSPGRTISRQPPHSRLMVWNSRSTQRRAAPTPRVSEPVSDRV